MIIFVLFFRTGINTEIPMKIYKLKKKLLKALFKHPVRANAHSKCPFWPCTIASGIFVPIDLGMRGDAAS